MRADSERNLNAPLQSQGSYAVTFNDFKTHRAISQALARCSFLTHSSCPQCDGTNILLTRATQIIPRLLTQTLDLCIWHPHLLQTHEARSLHTAMSLSDYLAKNYLTADPKPDKKSKKRKRKDASKSITIADDDDASGWKPAGTHKDDEDGPVTGALLLIPHN